MLRNDKNAALMQVASKIFFDIRLQWAVLLIMFIESFRIDKKR